MTEKIYEFVAFFSVNYGHPESEEKATAEGYHTFVSTLKDMPDEALKVKESIVRQFVCKPAGAGLQFTKDEADNFFLDGNLIYFRYFSVSRLGQSPEHISGDESMKEKLEEYLLNRRKELEKAYAKAAVETNKFNQLVKMYLMLLEDENSDVGKLMELSKKMNVLRYSKGVFNEIGAKLSELEDLREFLDEDED